MNSTIKNEIKRETATGLYYSVTRQTQKERIVIEIRLDDDCKNGYCCFSLTCMGYELVRNIWRDTFGGCAHDDILRFCPDFADFAKLHLCNSEGAPTYAIENGLYIYEHKGVKACAEFLRITEEEAQKIFVAKDKILAGYLLVKLGIVYRWQKEAKKAIEHLEQLTGLKFKNPYSIKLLPITKEEYQQTEKRVKEGFYTPEQITDRIKIKRLEEAYRIKKEALKQYDKDILITKTKRDIIITLCDEIGRVDNTLLHEYKGEFTLSINWQTWAELWTDEEIKRATKILTAKYSELTINVKTRKPI